jgi:hypothetical protein
VSVRPIRRNTASLPTDTVITGIVAATTVRPRRNIPARRGSRAIANPAHEATSVPAGTAIATTSSELRTCRRMGPWANSFP